MLLFLHKLVFYSFLYQISSWQIPSEMTELKKKQDGEHLLSLPHANLSTEKGSTPISLNAPAISTGGRDAIAVKASVVPGPSSALDMIKKKLQDSGSPITSSPNPAPSGIAVSELNGSRTVDTTVKGLQSEDSRDKIKDANGDGNMSDSSSDSEDADSGPTKEECIIQFKVSCSFFLICKKGIMLLFLLNTLKVGNLISCCLFPCF